MVRCGKGARKYGAPGRVLEGMPKCLRGGHYFLPDVEASYKRKHYFLPSSSVLPLCNKNTVHSYFPYLLEINLSIKHIVHAILNSGPCQRGYGGVTTPTQPKILSVSQPIFQLLSANLSFSIVEK